MKNYRLLTVLVLMLSLPANTVLAEKGSIELRTEVKKVQTVTGKNGRAVQREVSAATVVPGDELLYTIFFRNVGTQPAGNIVINDPIPDNTRYKDGSAFGAGTVITYSVDGGKTFASADKLTVRGADGKSRKAVAADYTNIRWVFKPQLAPGKQGSVQFRVILN